MSTTPNIAPVVFSPELVRRVGPISAVLDLFLNEQMRRIQREINQEFTGANPLAVRKVLNQLVTLDGTKIPRKANDLELRNIRPEVIQAVLKKLVDARILRIADERYELAHDTLARTINEGRSAEELELIRIRKIVEGRLRDYPSTKTLLNAKELRLYQDKRAELAAERPLGAAAAGFVGKSRRVLWQWRIGIGALSTSLLLVLSLFLLSKQQLNLANSWLEQARTAESKEQNYNYALSRILYRNVAQLPAYTFTFGDRRVLRQAKKKLAEMEENIEKEKDYHQLVKQADALLDSLNGNDIPVIKQLYDRAASLGVRSEELANKQRDLLAEAKRQRNATLSMPAAPPESDEARRRDAFITLMNRIIDSLTVPDIQRPSPAPQ